MQSDDWSPKNEWLNEFSHSFVCNTHRLVRDITIETEEDCVLVRGRARSYYAVQLAIHAVQAFSRQRPRFPTTQLSLKVNDQLIELRITHHGQPKQRKEASTWSSQRPHELTTA